MYRSPIEVFLADIQHQIAKQEDEEIYKAVVNVGINVDKEEMIRALQYDRHQYAKGYADGKAAVLESIVKCNECKGWCTEEIAKQYGVDRYCTMTMMPTDADDFCSYGERGEG